MLDSQSRFSAYSFIFIDSTTTEIYTLSLHDALPILILSPISDTLPMNAKRPKPLRTSSRKNRTARKDRKSTRLNSSHSSISYAVFCLKKKNQYRTLSGLSARQLPPSDLPHRSDSHHP